MSIKSIPPKWREQATQLFNAFALAAEDTVVPLPILGMIFDACGDAVADKPAKPLSRAKVRRYLKVLIDRSLVLGTVDRPQLHDVMLGYVQKELSGAPYKTAQRRLVESLRKSDRSVDSETGKYIQQSVRHHIRESFESTWGEGEQAMSWLEDHVNGVQDVIATSAAYILPAKSLAEKAEAAEMWWQASLRWGAYAALKNAEAGAQSGGNEYLKRAVFTSANVVASNAGADGSGIASISQFDLDTFDLFALKNVLQAFDPADLAVYGERLRKVLATEAGRSRPLLKFGVLLAMEWFPAL